MTTTSEGKGWTPPRTMTPATLHAAKADLYRQLREARAMLNAVGFDDECDASFKRSWRKSLKAISAAIAKAEGRTQ